MMTVADVMSFQPIVVGRGDTVQEAARRMYQHVITALPVVDGATVVGMLTDRDLAVRVVASGKPPCEARVGEAMTPAPATCRQREPVEVAIDRMVIQCVRHLVVLDDNGKVTGVLSVNDLLKRAETGPLALRVMQQVAELHHEMRHHP